MRRRSIIVLLGFFLVEDFVQAKEQEKVVFSDFLFEDWDDPGTEWGTTALFDANAKAAEVSDICGTIDSFYFGRAYDGHKGWDRNIPNDHGKYVVFAAAPGTIVDVMNNCIEGVMTCGNGTGNRVKLDHGSGVVTKYFHGDHGSILVKKDQWVDRGTPLFIGDNTGNTTGAHAHFQVEINGTAIDPLGSSVSWLLAPIIDATKCASNQDPVHKLVLPYTLRDYAIDLFEEIEGDIFEEGYSEVTDDAGNFIKKPVWKLQSGGSDANDVLLKQYTNQKGDNGTANGTNKALIVFDLLGNAPKAIFLPPAMTAQWEKNQDAGNLLGKPITPLYKYDGMTQRMDFEKGFTTYMPLGQGQIGMTYYKDVCAGQFPNDTGAPGIGWKAGKSYAIVTAYLQHGGGKNYDNPKLVKTQNGYEFQEFESQSDSQSASDKGLAAFMLVPSNDNFIAYLIKPAIWKTYTKYGPEFFGAPLGDTEFNNEGKEKQDFEKGKIILENGLIVDAATNCIDDTSPTIEDACVCPGAVKEEPCGKCGMQQWHCNNYHWVKSGDCKSQGVCTFGQMASAECQCGGYRTSSCTMQCQWGKWTECAKQPTVEVCDKLDNDCDGVTDEQNVCCKNEVEKCDNIDNNCNGETDEGFGKTQCGVGWCDHIQYHCINGKWYDCDPFLDWQPEVCDGEDNDCDGETDEEKICCEPEEEVCDGLDNDCDDLIDEDKVCAPAPQDPPNNPPSDPPPQDPPPPPPSDPPPENPPPSDPPNPPPSPPPSQTNACGGTATLDHTPGTSCGSLCGTWTCSGTDGIYCVENGICIPGEQETKVCDTGTCGSGLKTRDCTSTCQWSDWSSCTTKKGYVYSKTPACGDTICLAIQTCYTDECTAVVTKAKGDAFSSNPTEWALKETLSGKTLKVAPGFGCEASYGGKTSFTITFTPPQTKENLLQLKFYSGGTPPCDKLYVSGTVALTKCE